MIYGNMIKTPRLSLRKPETRDVPLLVEWGNSETANGPYLTPDGLSRERTMKDIAAETHWCEHHRNFMIELREGTPIGTIHYWLRPEMSHCGVIAVKIANTSLRNRGYGTEAQKYLIIYLFQRLRVEAVEMYTDVNNVPQQRCLQKLGFELIETLQYQDGGADRTGHLYRLKSETFSRTSVYHYHYEH